MITRGIARGIVCPTVFLSVFLSVVATGAVSFTVGDISGPSPGFTTQIGVVSSDTSAWSGYIIMETGGGTLTNPATTQYAGQLSTIAAYSNDLGSGFRMDVPPLTTIGGPPFYLPRPYNNQQAGTQFTMDLSFQYGALISLWDESRDVRLGPVQWEMVYEGAGMYGSGSANCRGPYWIAPGEEIPLLGYGSYGEYILWRIDGHQINTVGDEAVMPISYDYLVNTLGLAPGVHTVEMEVGVYQYPISDPFNPPPYLPPVFDYTTLTIVPEPVSAMFLGLGFLMVARRLESTEKNISRRAR